MNHEKFFSILAFLALVIPFNAFSQDNTVTAQPDVIAQATDYVKNRITSLDHLFQYCYINAIKKDNTNLPANHLIKYNLEYDETGYVYFIQPSTHNKKLNSMIDKCFNETIPNKFNLNLPDSIRQEISMYPEGVQKFGKLSFSHNIKTKETTITSSQPIGTKHTPEDWESNNIDKHFIKYQKRNADLNAETDILKATMAIVETDLKKLEPQLSTCFDTSGQHLDNIQSICLHNSEHDEHYVTIHISYNSKGSIVRHMVLGADKQASHCVRSVLENHTFPLDVSEIITTRTKTKVRRWTKPYPAILYPDGTIKRGDPVYVNMYSDTGTIIVLYYPHTNSFAIGDHLMIGHIKNDYIID